MITVSVFNTCQIAKTLLNTVLKYVGKCFPSAITIIMYKGLIKCTMQSRYLYYYTKKIRNYLKSVPLTCQHPPVILIMEPLLQHWRPTATNLSYKNTKIYFLLKSRFRSVQSMYLIKTFLLFLKLFSRKSRDSRALSRKK